MYNDRQGGIEGLDENEFIRIKPQQAANTNMFSESLAQKIASHVMNKGVLENQTYQ